MFSGDLSTREFDGHVVVTLGGELDLVDAAGVTAALVEEAAGSAGRSRRAVVLMQQRRRMRWPNTTMRLGTRSSGAEQGSPRKRTEALASPTHSRTADPMTVMDGLVCQSATRNAVVRDPAAVAPLAG